MNRNVCLFFVCVCVCVCCIVWVFSWYGVWELPTLAVQHLANQCGRRNHFAVQLPPAPPSPFRCPRKVLLCLGTLPTRPHPLPLPYRPRPGIPTGVIASGFEEIVAEQRKRRKDAKAAARGGGDGTFLS